MFKSKETGHPQAGKDSTFCKLNDLSPLVPKITSTPMNSHGGPSSRSATRLSPGVTNQGTPRRYSLSEATPGTSRSTWHPQSQGPLLTTLNYKDNVSLYEETKSFGIAKRIVLYNEEAEEERRVTHQEKYNVPGMFPVVHLFKKQQPVLGENSRRVKVKLSSPEYLRLCPAEEKRKLLAEMTKPALQRQLSLPSHSPVNDVGTKSVLDALKEISRKRIHSGKDRDFPEDSSKRIRTELQNGTATTSSKRARADSPLLDTSTSPTIRQIKKKLCVYDEFAASKSSSDLSTFVKSQPLSIKRKTTSTSTESLVEPKQVKLVNAETQTIIPVSESKAESTRSVSVAVQPRSRMINNTIKVFDDAPLDRIRKSRLAALMGRLTGKNVVLPLESPNKQNCETVEQPSNKTETQPGPDVAAAQENNPPKTPTSDSLPAKQDKHVHFDLPADTSSQPERASIPEEKAVPSPHNSLNVTSIENPVVSSSNPSPPKPGGFKFDLKVATPTKTPTFSFGKPDDQKLEIASSLGNEPPSTATSSTTSSFRFGSSSPSVDVKFGTFGSNTTAASVPAPSTSETDQNLVKSVPSIGFGGSAPSQNNAGFGAATTTSSSAVNFTFGSNQTSTSASVVPFGTTISSSAFAVPASTVSSSFAAPTSTAFGVPKTSASSSTFPAPSSITPASNSFGVTNTTASSVAFPVPSLTQASNSFGVANTTTSSVSFPVPSLTPASNYFGVSNTTASSAAFPVPSLTPASNSFGASNTTASSAAFPVPSLTPAPNSFGVSNTTASSAAFPVPSLTAAPNSFGVSNAPASFALPASGSFGAPNVTASFAPAASSSFGASFAPPSLTPASGAFGAPSSIAASTSFASPSITPASGSFGVPNTTVSFAAPTASTFGSSSFKVPSFGSSQSAFGATTPSTVPSFGTATTNVSSPFNSSSSAFGSKTAQPFGSGTNSAFGVPPAQSVFGASSAKPANPPPPYGSGAFSTTSAPSAPVFSFGASKPANVFGVPTTTTASSFGAATSFTSSSGFGSGAPAFGVTTSAANSFGSTSAPSFGQADNKPKFAFGSAEAKGASVFGSGPGNSFGKPANASGGGFGAAASNVFGSSNPASTVNSQQTIGGAYNFGSNNALPTSTPFAFGSSTTSSEPAKPSFSFTSQSPATFGSSTFGASFPGATSAPQQPGVFNIGAGSAAKPRAQLRAKRRT